jgi:hypothetical protein
LDFHRYICIMGGFGASHTPFIPPLKSMGFLAQNRYKSFSG